MSKFFLDEAQAELIDLRSDPKRSAARYDEIIKLREFLLVIREDLRRSEDPYARYVRREILRVARTWGKPGDVV